VKRGSWYYININSGEGTCFAKGRTPDRRRDSKTTKRAAERGLEKILERQLSTGGKKKEREPICGGEGRSGE